ncbi:MAG: PIN domain-containing protein [Acidimicrobiales bacterium]|nr:PIN domain-containing protein [Acidimicrobiales bacterium]
MARLRLLRLCDELDAAHGGPEPEERGQVELAASWLPARRPPGAAAGARLVLDAGAVLALLGPAGRARAWVRWMAEHGGVVVVPAPVVADVVAAANGREPELERALRGLMGGAGPEVVDEDVARLAGWLRKRAGGRGDAVDALVAAEALVGGDPAVVLTGRVQELRDILRGVDRVAVVGV